MPPEFRFDYFSLKNFLFCQLFHAEISEKMTYNVSAVYDGLTARIEKCAAFLGLAKCGYSEPWEWSVPQRSWGAE
jgi:hypothetical protein